MRISILVVLLFFFFAVSAQEIEFNIKSYPGIWNNASAEWFNGGGGAALFYNHPLPKNSIRGGLEFRSIDWGNQASFSLGYDAVYLLKEKWSLNGISSVGIGMALFRPNPLMVWSVEYLGEFNWLTKKRFNLSVGLGIRYSHNPAYKKYGAINQVLEFPVKIGFGYFLKKSENQAAERSDY